MFHLVTTAASLMVIVKYNYLSDKYHHFNDQPKLITSLTDVLYFCANIFFKFCVNSVNKDESLLLCIVRVRLWMAQRNGLRVILYHGHSSTQDFECFRKHLSLSALLVSVLIFSPGVIYGDYRCLITSVRASVRINQIQSHSPFI